MKSLNSQKGFTLIELLVVISIISLLSSIIFSFIVDAKSGAKNNRKNELVRQYVTALSLYHNEYGEYPEGGCTIGIEDGGTCNSISFTCLGSGYPEGYCYILGEHSEDATVNSQISEFAPSLPPSLDITSTGSENFIGIGYGCTDSNCTNYQMIWTLEGEGNDSNCFGGANKLDLGTINLCTFNSNTSI